MTANAIKTARLRGQVWRFLIVGGANTLATYAIFIILGLFIEPWAAYTIAFLSGVAWTVFGSARFVFRVRSSPRRLLIFAATYLLVYLLGRAIIWLMNPEGFKALLISSILVLVVTTPLVFVSGRLVFAKSIRTTNLAERKKPLL